MGIERWAVSNTQFAPKADGMWVRHEDHEAAMGEAQERLYAEMKTGDLLAGQRDEAQARAEQANEGRTEAHAQRDKALAERDLAVGQAEAINDLIHAERARASAKVASLTARLLHYEELMVERAVKERAGTFGRTCRECRYWGDANAHAVVCWACTSYSCWRPKPEERRCSNCAHAMDEEMAPPCVDCKTTAIGWNPPTNWEPKT